MKEVIVKYNDDGQGNAQGELVGELIRCADCKFYTRESAFTNAQCKIMGAFALVMGRTDYCSNAKRRE